MHFKFKLYNLISLLKKIKIKPKNLNKGAVTTVCMVTKEAKWVNI